MILGIIAFIVGLFAGLCLGSWMDSNDILYSCSKCRNCKSDKNSD